MSFSENPVLIKAVTVGYGAVGKTSMILTITNDEFPGEYVPHAADISIVTREIMSRTCNISFWDTAGHEGYERLRPVCYPGSDVFLLLFDVADHPHRFEGIQNYWLPELNHHCPNVPIILIASKIDLRANRETNNSPAEGQLMAEKIGAVKYKEISSLEGKGIADLLEEVVNIGYHHSTCIKASAKKIKCIIL